MTDTWTTELGNLLAGRAGPLLAAACIIVVLVVGAVAATRRVRPDRLLAWAAAAIATGVSGTGMWQVADKALHLDGPLRAVLFGFAEIALLSSAIRARRHHQAHGRGGPDAAGVWVIAAAAGCVSAMESTSPPEAVVRLAAPLLAAWLWHRGLDDTGGTAKTVDAVTMRLTARRLLVALRLAEPGTVGLAQIDRGRRLDAVVLAAVRLDAATGRARNRAARRLHRAGRTARGHLDRAGISYIRTTLATIYGLHTGTSRGAVADLVPWAGTPAIAPQADPVGEDDPTPDPWAYAEQLDQPASTPRPSTARNARSDTELLHALADVPPGRDGTPSIRAVKKALGVNQDRAKRLLTLAGHLPAAPEPTAPTQVVPTAPAPVPVHPVNGVPAPALTHGDTP
jgi:hypothetical protein